jgi:hypothetical protein
MLGFEENIHPLICFARKNLIYFEKFSRLGRIRKKQKAFEIQDVFLSLCGSMLEKLFICKYIMTSLFYTGTI